MVYNIMTCQGPGWSTSVLGDCSLAWISFAIIFFIVLIARRQAEDGFLAGMGFNIFGAIILGLGGNILATTFLGSARWSFVAGLAGIAIGGFLIGRFMDTGGGGE